MDNKLIRWYVIGGFYSANGINSKDNIKNTSVH